MRLLQVLSLKRKDFGAAEACFGAAEALTPGRCDLAYWRGQMHVAKAEALSGAAHYTHCVCTQTHARTYIQAHACTHARTHPHTHNGELTDGCARTHTPHRWTLSKGVHDVRSAEAQRILARSRAGRGGSHSCDVR